MRRSKKPLGWLLAGVGCVVGVGHALAAEPGFSSPCVANDSSCTKYFGLNLEPSDDFGDPLKARNAFLGRSGATESGTENFSTPFGDGKNPRAPFPLFVPKEGTEGQATLDLAKGAVASRAYLTACVPDSEQMPAVECFGRFDTSGDEVGAWWESAESFTISFVNAISAFGFYATDVGDFRGSLSLELTGETQDDDLLITVLEPPDPDTALGGPASNVIPPDGSLLFFGISDTERRFTSITFRLDQSTSNFDYMGFDDLVFTEASPSNVPEPTTLALVAASLAGLAATRRRRPS